MSAPLLDVTGLRRTFGGVKAVDGFDLSVARADIVGLIGPNGAGKTTVVNLITGHVRPDGGSIRLVTERSGASELAGRAVHATARLGLARTFQNLRLYSALSVLDNVVIGSHAHRRSDVLATLVPVGRGRRARSERIEAARDLLARVGLDPDRFAGRAAGTLAYGDQRRVEVARALALQPRLLLLDEPAAGMNPVEKDGLADLFRSLVAETSLTIVLVEHDLRLVMGVCSRVAVMDFGRKIADGSPGEVAEDPAVVTAYLGRRAVAPVRHAPHPSTGAALLEVTGLDVSYGAIRAVEGVNLRVEEGEVVTLIGANGAGKTTILRSLSGLVRAGAGSARFGTLDLRGASSSEIVAAGLIHVPEGREILGRLTVEENLALGAWRRKDRRTVLADIDAQLERFPVLASRRRLAAGQLSGGEQQTLAIARALLARPRLLLLDEPSLGLAPQLADAIFDLVASLASDGMTILLVEQNAMQALHLANRGYVLENGRITISGSANELLDDPQVRAAYLGT